MNGNGNRQDFHQFWLSYQLDVSQTWTLIIRGLCIFCVYPVIDIQYVSPEIFFYNK